MSAAEAAQADQWATVDRYFHQKLVDEDSADPAVLGTRTLIDQIAEDDRLSATALQTVGIKGWDGFTLARVA